MNSGFLELQGALGKISGKPVTGLLRFVYRESPFGWLRASGSTLSVRAVQFQEVDRRGLAELDAEVAGDLAQGVVEVGEVVDGHVANEGAANFVIARASVQPAEEEKHLQERGESDDDPVGIHGCTARG